MREFILFICFILFGFTSSITCLSTIAFAQESVETLPEIVVTATRYKEEYNFVPLNVSVITEEDIENSTAQFIPDLLKTQADIKVSDIAGNKRSYNVDIRGFGETGGLNTLVLIDGRKVNHVDLSGTDWTQIPLDRVKRIEVIRGGRGSVLYGDNAAGGVINIITKKGEELKSGGEIDGGSFGTSRGEAYISNSSDNASLFISGSLLNSNGYRRNSYTNAKDSGINMEYHFNSLAVNISGGYHEDKTGLPGALKESDLASGVSRTSSLNPDDFADVKDYYIHMVPEIYFKNDSSFKVDTSFRKRDSLSYSSFAGGNFKGDTTIGTFALLPQLFLNNDVANLNNKLTIGLDYYSAGEDITNDSLYFGISSLGKYKLGKTNYGYYMFDELELLQGLRVSGGYRSDSADYSFEPGTPAKKTWSESSYTIGVNYNLNGKYFPYISFTRSFRYPVLDELYSFFTNTVNTGLLNQNSDDFELGVKIPFSSKRYGNVSFFRVDTKNEIFYNALSYANMNMDGLTRREGMEISCSNEFDWMVIRGSYTYMEAKTKDGSFAGKDIPDVPRHKAAADASFTPARGLTLNVGGIYV
ncbi:MAG TPA: hypothetical protein DCQ99_07960, partial [Nitrospinae bacterium]|nr:hypothetical protein [Nitrospinota bacterium]